MKKRYFAYIRVSTVKQGEHGSSLAEQKSAIEEYAARNDLSVVGWFEEMQSAAKQGRREFSRMLKQLQAGKAEGVVIHKVDRSARNPKDWANLGELIDQGIDVRFVSDNFDLQSRGGRLSADIQAVIAADYIRNLREEVKKGLYGRLKTGIYPFAAPVGYLNMGKGRAKAIDPVKGPLIRHMFERYASNTIGFEDLRLEMWRKGLATSKGKPLNPNSLTHILNNPFYIGIIRLQRSGRIYPGAHQPLIAKALFDRVQAILRGKTVLKAKTHTFLFRQFIRCSNCDRRSLTGERQKGIVYYRCHERTCRGISWGQADVERVIGATIARIRLDAEGFRDVRELGEKKIRDNAANRGSTQASIDLEIENIDARLSRITDLLLDSTIDADTFNAQREKLFVARRGALDRKNRYAKNDPLEEVLNLFELTNSLLLRYETMSEGEKRDLLETICSNVSANAQSVTIALNSPYDELSKFDNPQKCAPRRDDLRTFRIVGVLDRVAANDNMPLSWSLSSLSPCVRRQRPDSGSQKAA
jgi:DNA invertase Pin-like site-specific DNA recombinase